MFACSLFLQQKWQKIDNNRGLKKKLEINPAGTCCGTENPSKSTSEQLEIAPNHENNEFGNMLTFHDFLDSPKKCIFAPKGPHEALPRTIGPAGQCLLEQIILCNIPEKNNRKLFQSQSIAYIPTMHVTHSEKIQKTYIYIYINIHRYSKGKIKC